MKLNFFFFLFNDIIWYCFKKKKKILYGIDHKWRDIYLFNTKCYRQSFIESRTHAKSQWDILVQKVENMHVKHVFWLFLHAEGYCWSRTSERQVLRIRYMYLEASLRQEVGFFDSQEATTTEIIESISKDTSLIQEVLSEKVRISSHLFFLIFGISVLLSFNYFYLGSDKKFVLLHLIIKIG